VVKGLGIDVVEVPRFAAALTRHGRRLEERLFTDRERADCEGRADRVQSLAARFAAKEAAFKALGTGWAEGVAFRQIEVQRAENGAPSLRFHGRAAERADQMGAPRAHVSLTHQPGVAAAVVLLEG